MELTGFGISIDLPSGWEGRIFKNADDEESHAFPIVHLTDFPLRVVEANFAGPMIATMDSSSSLLVLCEYGPEQAGTPLFAAGAPPNVIRLGDLYSDAFFGPHHHSLLARQWFFTLGSRAFCLYVVLGTEADAIDRLDQINSILASISVETN